MLIGRSYGGNAAISTPFNKTRPEVGVSNPASMRNKVDFPHPELPSNIGNSQNVIKALDQIFGQQKTRLVRVWQCHYDKFLGSFIFMKEKAVYYRYR